jgi:hypothetical protein
MRKQPVSSLLATKTDLFAQFRYPFRPSLTKFHFSFKILAISESILFFPPSVFPRQHFPPVVRIPEQEHRPPIINRIALILAEQPLHP